MKAIDHILRLFEYETACTAKVIESLWGAKRAVEAGGGRALPALQKALSIFAHIQVARRLWLSRVDRTGRVEPPPMTEGFFPVWPLDEAAAEAQRLDELWLEFVRGVDAVGLDRRVAYRTTEGKDAAAGLHDLLTHVVNHSSYHRGQIARFVAECGGDAAVTDYIWWALEKGVKA
jgi:uncharacterized damage-inducible protein DinB